MNPTTNILSDRENRILRLLSVGESYESIRSTLGMSLGNMHATAWVIRQKTGIKNTLDKDECRMYYRKCAQEAFANEGKPPVEQEQNPKLFLPTPRQQHIMHLWAVEGKTHKEISAECGISVTAVYNALCRGSWRAGIVVPSWRRAASIQAWFEQGQQPKKTPPIVKADPMDDPAF